ncbi:hypothetical protein OIDMADRAFT_61107 [Oidiodendron maius Zn]|uniref:NAD(P)-binding domain-containing protein n=1 Tax=Oidiodendron maius (strain Zn) TaxID=913774 RepID=A0A0C3CVU4_OIDMZ|nr:hypothetical protein OIDMADRAFT_61107 [Oidiodendron maius Zn]
MGDSSNPCTIAIFGATGHTGRVIVRHLLAQQKSKSLRLQIYVRNKGRLLDFFPDIESKRDVRVFQGLLTDTEVVKRTLSAAQIIICTLGENDNIPGVRILQDGANSIIASLEDFKANQEDWQKPRLFLLSSSTFNARFAADRPPLVHWLIKTAFSHPYADLIKAQARLLESTSLLSVTLIQPPVLIDEEGTGHEINTESVRLAVSYEDLGAAFCELVLEEQYHNLNAVGVSSKQGDRVLRYAPEILRRIFWGMYAHIIHLIFHSKA